MRRPDLSGLPGLPTPRSGWTLRTLRSDDANELASFANVLQKAFADESWTPEKAFTALPGDPTVQTTFVILNGPEIIATASARLLPERYPGSGYVHWVAADPAFAGQGLGHAVTLAVLHEFVRLGCHDSVLTTDDFRLPAIKTYWNLGFRPDFTHESQRERWASVTAQLFPSIK